MPSGRSFVHVELSTGLATRVRCIAMQDNATYIDGMGRQLTVRLPDDLGDELEAAAERTQRKSSEIVRLALRAYLGSFDRRTRHADRVRSLIGSLDSGIPDLAENHREHIIEALRRGK